MQRSLIMTICRTRAQQTIFLLLLGLFVQGCRQNKNPMATYYEFDRSPGKGWRELSDKGRFLEAARLIDHFIKDHPDLPVFTVKMLYLHAGQVYAFAGDNAHALERLRSSLYSEDIFPPWNPGVQATIAFLNQDMAQLQYWRKTTAEGPLVDGKPPNTAYVDQLIKDFGKAYRDIDPTSFGGTRLPPSQVP